MPIQRDCRVILIGLDGAIPEFVERFRDRLPNFDRFMREGLFTPALAAIPTDTPTNWTTIATGAWPGTHGVLSFATRAVGEPIGASWKSFDTPGLCQAEYIWQAAERSSKRPILINYPVAWPPTVKNGIVIGGHGVSSPLWRLAGPEFYCTPQAMVPGATEIRLEPAEKWTGMPKSRKPPLETALLVNPSAKFEWSSAGPVMVESKEPLQARELFALVLANGDSGYNTVMVSEERDVAKGVEIRVGEWSKPMRASVGAESEQGVFWLRLLELSPDGSRLQLLRTMVGAAEGWAHPKAAGERFIKYAGPFVQGVEVGSLGRRGFYDYGVDLEHAELQCGIVADAAAGFARDEKWDLLMIQLHIQDAVNHYLAGRLYPEGPNYDPDLEEQAWDWIRRSYEIADAFVGHIIERCADENTVVAVVSDHGCLPTGKYVFTGLPLIQRGLMVYEPGEEEDVWVLNEERSQACFHLFGYVHVNLKGREPGGMVEPGEEYEQVREEIIEALLSIRDPDTGRCPICFAMRKEDAVHFGQWGDRVGDVIYGMHPEYCDVQPLARDELRFAPKGDLSATSLLTHGGVVPRTDLSGIHQGMPDARLGPFSNHAMFGLLGPGILPGAKPAGPMHLVDVAPTLAYLGGFSRPAQAEGRVLLEVMDAERG